MERDVETNGVLQTCEEFGIGFVPWGPLGMGYLTGTIDANTKLDPMTDLADPQANFSTLTVHGGRLNDMQMQLVERAG